MCVQVPAAQVVAELMMRPKRRANPKINYGDHHDGENHHFYLRCYSDSREQQDEQGWTEQYAINKSIDSATPSNLHHIGVTEIK